MNTPLYNERILELYETRPHFGELKNKTHEITLKNPNCNDKIHIELQVKNNVVTDAKFKGTHCFVSIVSASALLEKIKGMSIQTIQQLTKKEIDSILGIELTQTRIGCQLFPLEAVKKCLEKNDLRN